MKLLEYQGKELLQKYGIQVPASELVTKERRSVSLGLPCVLKSQVPAGDRKRKGGILVVAEQEGVARCIEELFQNPIDGYVPEVLLAEEKVAFSKELYLSFSYDTATRGPVLSLSAAGGTGIAKASVSPVPLVLGLPDFFVRNALQQAGIAATQNSMQVIRLLWEVFSKEQALLVEINPLFELADGTYVAGDAKIILDDNVANPSFRPYVELEGDIAVLASGGGASLINLDALLKYKGKPANYVEYSGNPPASVVEELTLKVLSKKGLKGCWVVGGTANFTDIYETLLGFVQGLRKVTPKPTYPIVIRRDGPRQQEAFAMLREIGNKEGYDFHMYGPETPMSESARILVELMEKQKHSKNYEYSR